MRPTTHLFKFLVAMTVVAAFLAGVLAAMFFDESGYIQISDFVTVILFGTLSIFLGACSVHEYVKHK